jgi:hypothetical protein
MAVMKLFRMRMSHDTSMAYDPQERFIAHYRHSKAAPFAQALLKSPAADPGLSISKSLLLAPGFASIKVVYSVARPLLSELFC